MIWPGVEVMNHDNKEIINRHLSFNGETYSGNGNGIWKWKHGYILLRDKTNLFTFYWIIKLIFKFSKVNCLY